jgi:hypothetical protein
MFIASLLHTLDYVRSNRIVGFLLRSLSIGGTIFRAFCHAASQLIWRPIRAQLGRGEIRAAQANVLQVLSIFDIDIRSIPEGPRAHYTPATMQE